MQGYKKTNHKKQPILLCNLLRRTCRPPFANKSSRFSLCVNLFFSNALPKPTPKPARPHQRPRRQPHGARRRVQAGVVHCLPSAAVICGRNPTFYHYGFSCLVLPSYFALQDGPAAHVAEAEGVWHVHARKSDVTRDGRPQPDRLRGRAQTHTYDRHGGS